MRVRVTAVVFALACIACTCAVADVGKERWLAQQRAAVAKSESLMSDAEKQKGLLAQYWYMREAFSTDSSENFRLVFNQYLSWYLTFIGAYDDARTAFSIKQLPEPDDGAAPFEIGYSAKSADDAIVELARNRNAVFFNEAHNAPVTRSLTVPMLKRLREIGFDTFAAETLYDSDDGLAKRGYPVDDSGFYTQEPIYGEMVRTALKLGYRVVAYESESEKGGNQRELEQATNLYDRTFKHDPKARVVVNAGYAHIQEAGRYLGGEAMAQHFRRIADIDPLTIEQTMLIEHDGASKDHPYYRTYAASARKDEPTVYVDPDGKPWSLKPDAYDVSVFLPVSDRARDRPAWLTLGGLRTTYQVGGDLCQRKFPCLVEARYAGESDRAVAADRVMFVRPGVTTQLFLRPGRYSLTATSLDNQLMVRLNITVGNATRNP